MVHNAFMCCYLGRILLSIFVTDTGLSFSVFVMHLWIGSAVPSARAASMQERRMWAWPLSCPVAGFASQCKELGMCIWGLSSDFGLTLSHWVTWTMRCWPEETWVY